MGKDDVKEAQADLAALSKQQAEMDTIRREENAAYTQAKADLELGLSGVRKALEVLRNYYGSASAALVQQPAMPEQHSKSGGAAGSIINILEVCESDFAGNLAKEETQESDAVSAYEKTPRKTKSGLLNSAKTSNTTLRNSRVWTKRSRNCLPTVRLQTLSLPVYWITTKS